MKIAVIGGAGKAGSLIAAEAKNRGHLVTVIVRPSGASGASGISGGCALLARDLFDLRPDDLREFDAVVSAFGTPFDRPGNERLHVEAARHLITVFKSLPDVRLLVVGGAGSLYKTPDRERLVIEDIPGPFRAVPENQKAALNEFSKSDINWTFFSPAAVFDPGGCRTGKYSLGGDFQIFNTVGESYISYADYAVAMVDEIENRAHQRRRFTAVSNDPYFRDARQFFAVGQNMFSRRGAWMGLQADYAAYGRGSLFLMTNRGGKNNSGDRTSCRLYRIYPTFKGKKVPFAIQSGAVEYTLHTRHGDVRFTWADSAKLMAEGDPGMGLYFFRNGEAYEVPKPRRDGAWESLPRNAKPLLFKGLDGSSFKIDDTWDFDAFKSSEIRGRTYPNAEGKFTLVVEEFFYAAHVRDSYPSYAEAKASMQADWEAFLEKMPHFIEPFEQKREETAYTLWSLLLAPGEMTPNWLILMFPTVMGSQWQHVQNAVALQDHTDLSLELLLAHLVHQSEEGQVSVGYDDASVQTGGIKPHIYGWALKIIMRNRDIAKQWPRDKIEKLYQGICRWTEWFMNYRDEDRDGLPAFEGGTENGLDEATIWYDQVNMASPDVSAYTVLNYEVQGDLAKALGKGEDEVNKWYIKSKELLQRMIDRLWDGEHFVALREYTHEKVFTGSLVHYFPLVLGSRLPTEIIDRMVADLSVEGVFLCPSGLATERLDSDLFEFQGLQMGRGSINPPAELFICTGLWDAGKKEVARTIVNRYCGTLMKNGFLHNVYPLTGEGISPGGSWPRCAFTILCRMVSGS